MRALQRVLVTGGAGFLGSALCSRLLAGGARRVLCLDNLSTSSPANIARLGDLAGLDFVEHDITEPFDDPRRFGRLDAVFHLASPASPPDYLRLPIATLRAGAHGTAAALHIAAACAARFVLASTSEVYGDPQVHPQPESYWGNVNPVGPRSVYDEAKRFAEALTFAHYRSGRSDVAVARIFNSYGPGMRADDGRMVPTFCCQALRNAPITVTGSGHQTRSLCYVDDTVAALIALAAGDISGPVNIGNPGELTVLAVAELIRDRAASTSPICHVAAKPMTRSGVVLTSGWLAEPWAGRRAPICRPVWTAPSRGFATRSRQPFNPPDRGYLPGDIPQDTAVMRGGSCARTGHQRGVSRPGGGAGGRRTDRGGGRRGTLLPA